VRWMSGSLKRCKGGSTGSPMTPNAKPSEEIAELLRGEACISDDATHGERVYRIVPWDGHDPCSIRHDDMLALPGDVEPGLFECLAAGRWGIPGMFGIRDAGISTSLKFCSPASCLGTSRYSRIASWMFAKASFSVAPCDQHPGRPGQETLYPSSVCIKATGYFTPSLYHPNWRRWRQLASGAERFPAGRFGCRPHLKAAWLRRTARSSPNAERKPMLVHAIRSIKTKTLSLSLRLRSAWDPQ